MVRGRSRSWVLLGVTAVLLTVGGCESSPPDEGEQTPRPPGLPPEDKVAAATNKYLRGPGAILVELHRDAAKIPGTLDDAALADRCKRLRGTLGDRYPTKKLLARLHGLPDPQAGRLWTSELDALLSTVESCALGERDKARRRADVTAAAAKDLGNRLAELREVEER
jgi:hypothetical protein